MADDPLTIRTGPIGSASGTAGTVRYGVEAPSDADATAETEAFTGAVRENASSNHPTSIARQDAPVRDAVVRGPAPDERTIADASADAGRPKPAAVDGHAWLPDALTRWAAKNAKGGDNVDKALKPLTIFLPTTIALAALGLAAANLDHSEHNKS